MMNLEALDADLRDIEECLNTVEDLLSKKSNPQFFKISNCWQTLETELQELQRLIELTRHVELTEKPSHELPKAALFWMRDFADRLCDYGLRYREYIEKLLWLNLFRGRLLGGNLPFRLEMSATDVRYMLKQKQMLESASEILGKENKNLLKVEDRLKDRYNRLQFEDVGRKAAQSFGSPFPSAANQRKTFEAFGRVLQTLGMHTQRDEIPSHYLQNLALKFTTRSQYLMQKSSELLRQGHSPRTKKKQSITYCVTENIEELKRLECEIDTAIGRLAPRPLAGTPSLIVKKNQNQANSILVPTDQWSGESHEPPYKSSDRSQ